MGMSSFLHELRIEHWNGIKHWAEVTGKKEVRRRQKHLASAVCCFPMCEMMWLGNDTDPPAEKRAQCLCSAAQPGGRSDE